MIFEFTASQDFDFITQFARQINVPVRDNFLEIPKHLGEGYIRKVAFGNYFRLLIHRYTLKENLIIQRNPSIERNDLISIFFYNNEKTIELKYNDEKPLPFSQKNDSAIQIKYTMHDFSSAMHELAHQRLGPFAQHVRFIQADFKTKEWTSSLDAFDAVVTLQLFMNCDTKDTLQNFIPQFVAF